MLTVRALTLLCLLTASAAFSKDRVREFFEWGEYDSLLVAVAACFSEQNDTVPLDSTCVYYSYLGVAWFAKGDIAEAQRQFRSALNCNGTLTLDRRYVTPEMRNLFSSVKNEIDQQQAFLFQEKSIREAMIIQESEMESGKRKAAALGSAFWKSATLAASAGIVSLGLGTLAGYEYAKGNTGSVVRCSMASALCATMSVVFTIKSVSAHRLRKNLPRESEGSGAGGAKDY